MDTSNPIISSINLMRRKHKRLSIPPEADCEEEDGYEFLYNIEIKNKL